MKRITLQKTFLERMLILITPSVIDRFAVVDRGTNLNKDDQMKYFSLFLIFATTALFSSPLIGGGASSGGGVQGAIGVSFQSGIFVQEIWQGNDPYYEVYNQNSQAVTVELRTWPVTSKDAVGKLVKVISLNAGELKTVEAKSLLGQPGSYVNFSLNLGSAIGNIYLPTSSAVGSQIRTLAYSDVGLNATGDRLSGIWFAQSDLSYVAGSQFGLELYVQSHTGKLHFSKLSRSSVSLPQVSILSASMSAWRASKSFTADFDSR